MEFWPAIAIILGSLIPPSYGAVSSEKDVYIMLFLIPWLLWGLFVVRRNKL